MPTHTLSDYVTLRDGTTRFDGTPNAVVLGFDLPSDFVKGTSRAKPVLQFKLKVHQDTDLAILVNQTNNAANIDHEVALGAGGKLRSYHEFMNGSLFKPGQRNEIKFLLMDHSIFDDDDNDISIADVMLTYQRKITV